MEEILITGLDGSGKSTLLAALEQHKGDNDFEIVYLPHIETACLEIDSILYKTASFINTLSKHADETKSSALKAMAIFASMLLYRSLVQSKEQNQASTIFVERHPLIDTGIYAKFYAEKTGGDGLPKEVIFSLNEQFVDELIHLTNLIPDKLIRDKKPDIIWFMQFIFQRFFKEDKNSLSDLGEIFGYKLPSKIHYLKADPEILFGRITQRNRLEAHETQDVLVELSKRYDILMEAVSENGVAIDIINANDFENLNIFKEYLLKKYC